MQLGVVLFSLVVVFQLLTLPVEFDASARALRTLRERNMLESSELTGARKCGYEGNDLHKIVLEQNKPLFVDEVEGQKPNYDRYNIASSMLTYMNDSPAVISDGFNYIDDGSDVEQCKKVFELIFTAMHQKQHYKMMMGIED